MEAAYMAQLPSQGYRTWTCACGRLGLAAALDACPDCEQPQPAAGAPALPAPSPEPSPEPASRAPARRTRTRTPRGGSHG